MLFLMDESWQSDKEQVSSAAGQMLSLFKYLNLQYIALLNLIAQQPIHLRLFIVCSRDLL